MLKSFQPYKTSSPASHFSTPILMEGRLQRNHCLGLLSMKERQNSKVNRYKDSSRALTLSSSKKPSTICSSKSFTSLNSFSHLHSHSSTPLNVTSPLPPLQPHYLGSCSVLVSLNHSSTRLYSVSPNAANKDDSKMVFAKLLGYAVLLGSFIRSVPQISGMLAARSADGVSLLATAVQTACFTVNIAYNYRLGYPLHSYGELISCVIQEAMVLVLIVYFSHPPPLSVAFAAASIFAPPLLLFNRQLISDKVLAQLQTLTVAATALGSRVPQIWLVQERRNPGVLSGTTCLLNFLGNVARLYSSITVTKDGINIAGAALHAGLNAVLLLQVFKFGGRW
mmetsp:Transcript_20004/g.35986  ORF Transcript_20004/g.35986 Transcript_20004/m.35986 type:complete len:337 (-) Transcript_20004:97-1107(-)